VTGQENVLGKYFYGITKRLEMEIDYINEVIGHSGEKGTANEILLRDLLVKYLPKKYSVGSGLVIDKNGSRSNQIDVVIYDSYFHPELFSQGSGYLYPVDVVYMVIEIKTVIKKDKMEEAIENIRSVKRLDFIKSKILTIKNLPPEDPRLGQLNYSQRLLLWGLYLGSNLIHRILRLMIPGLSPIYR
jgi:hypothetical protein